MSETIDHLLDRRELRRKVTFWRVAAIVVLVGAVAASLGWSGAFGNLSRPGDHIARLSISGVISDNRKMTDLIGKIRKDDSVKGVILSINSPGGTTVGGEAIYLAVRELAEVKPVVASVGTLAASAGYMIASGSDHIVARRSSIVGSIGVIMQYPQAGAMLDKVGFQMKEVKSSPLKAEPSPFHTPPPGAEAMLQRIIDDSYQWFVGLVAERRKMERSKVLLLADGSIFTGAQGLANGLVDAIGGEDVAKNWLVEKKGISGELETVEWKPATDNVGFPFSKTLARLTGLPEELLRDNHVPTVPSWSKRLFLDGLLSIWHG